MKVAEKLLWILLVAPFIYIAIIWKNLPERLPMHFRMDGSPDRMGNKSELIMLLLILTGITLLSYYLTAYAYKLDPKKNASVNKEKMKKLALAVAFFMVFVMLFVIYTITRVGSYNITGMEGLPDVRIIFAGVGILYAIIGNYMHTLKPNYFAGIRVPWTLNDPENWRKTHLLAGKWWFWGGLLLAVLCIAAPAHLARFFMLTITVILCIVPVVYSYRLFKQQPSAEA